MKHLALILSFTSIIISLSAHAQEITIGRSVYILNEDNHTATFKRWYGEEDNESFLVIPEQVEYNGEKYKITVVGNGAGNENEKLTDVIIPNGVTKIDGGAFAYCGSLKNIKLPASLVSIGSNAFKHCQELESIVLPESIDTIHYSMRSPASSSNSTLTAFCSQSPRPTRYTYGRSRGGQRGRR